MLGTLFLTSMNLFYRLELSVNTEVTFPEILVDKVATFKYNYTFRLRITKYILIGLFYTHTHYYLHIYKAQMLSHFILLGHKTQFMTTVSDLQGQYIFDLHLCPKNSHRSLFLYSPTL